MENNIFGENLKELRKMNNMTQLELSKKLFKSKTTICQWEIGRQEPSLDDLKEIGKMFDVSVGFLLGCEDDFGIVNAHPELTERQKTLLDLYDQLPDVRQKTILDTMTDMVAARKVNKSTNKWA